MIVNVKEMVEENKIYLKEKVELLNKSKIYPKLAIIKASDDKASDVYVGKKRDLCSELGILEEEYFFDEKIKEDEVIERINKLNKDKSVHGILVQLPLFKHLDEKKIIDSLDPNKDVDGLTTLNFGKLAKGESGIIPCTPKGILLIIEKVLGDITGKNVTVVGRSNLVGKPMSYLMLAKGATVTVCHSKTKDLKAHTKDADILIVAVGKPGLITKDMVKKGSLVIDVGITRTENGIKGDVDTENVDKVADFVTKVPGGVGLTTVLSLMQNVIEIAEKSNLKK